VLLDNRESVAALEELLACAGELNESDESERALWSELVAEARQIDSLDKTEDTDGENQTG
jgi:hypothetical protein